MPTNEIMNEQSLSLSLSLFLSPSLRMTDCRYCTYWIGLDWTGLDRSRRQAGRLAGTVPFYMLA